MPKSSRALASQPVHTHAPPRHAAFSMSGDRLQQAKRTLLWNDMVYLPCLEQRGSPPSVMQVETHGWVSTWPVLDAPSAHVRMRGPDSTRVLLAPWIGAILPSHYPSRHAEESPCVVESQGTRP